MLCYVMDYIIIIINFDQKWHTNANKLLGTPPLKKKNNKLFSLFQSHISFGGGA